MLRRAHEVLREITPETQENVRKKKRVLEFQTCSHCGTSIEFEHRFEALGEFIVESGACPHCLAEVPARRYRVM